MGAAPVGPIRPAWLHVRSVSSYAPVVRTWKPERSTWTDPRSGVEVTQWTHYKGHSHHFYFTNPGWWDGGRRLLFGSDREGRTNLFSLDLADGGITQLTDSDMPPPPAETSFLFACVNPTRDEAYYWRGPDLIAIDLPTGRERTLGRAPDSCMDGRMRRRSCL